MDVSALIPGSSILFVLVHYLIEKLNSELDNKRSNIVIVTLHQETTT